MLCPALPCPALPCPALPCQATPACAARTTRPSLQAAATQPASQSRPGRTCTDRPARRRPGCPPTAPRCTAAAAGWPAWRPTRPARTAARQFVCWGGSAGVHEAGAPRLCAWGGSQRAEKAAGHAPAGRNSRACQARTGWRGMGGMGQGPPHAAAGSGSAGSRRVGWSTARSPPPEGSREEGERNRGEKGRGLGRARACRQVQMLLAVLPLHWHTGRPPAAAWLGGQQRKQQQWTHLPDARVAQAVLLPQLVVWH